MRKIIAIIGIVLVCVGCANRGIGPQGGPRDSIPPQPLRSVPENGALNFTGKKIDVTFSEYLQLDNISQNLLMSPPQQHAPEVKANGKHLIVQFEDTLKPNTTYTLDFGHSVCDFTERNPLPNYTFAFSTGPVTDTLQLSGRVYDAENLNPLKGITVGVYANLEDSAFTRLPFDRIGRTDSVGAFRIGNMQEGVSEGHAASCFTFSQLYYMGLGVEQDKQKNYELLCKSLELDYQRAKLMLARCYIEGEVVEKDLAKAKQLLIDLADNDDDEACAFLADYIFKGTFPDLSGEDGVLWLEKAANLGNINAMGRLAVIMGNICQDEKASYWFNKAKEAGLQGVEEVQ